MIGPTPRAPFDVIDDHRPLELCHDDHHFEIVPTSRARRMRNPNLGAESCWLGEKQIDARRGPATGTYHRGRTIRLAEGRVYLVKDDRSDEEGVLNLLLGSDSFKGHRDHVPD